MRSLKDLLKLITEDDLPDTYKQIAFIGIDNIVKIAELFGGTWQYMPKLDSILKEARDREIKDEFNGYNYDELARKYNLSSQWIRNIVEPILKEKRMKPMEGQIDLLNTQSS